MRYVLVVTVAAAAALWAAPHPCAAAQPHLRGAEPRSTPSPTHYRIERQMSLLATVVRYVEDHVGVEVVPDSVDRIGAAGTPLELVGTPAGAAARPTMAGVFAVGAGPNPLSALGRMSAAVSASQNRLHLTLRLRW